MPANFDGTSAEPQPNKNTEDVNHRKNKENMPNEQLSEKEEQKRTNHGLTALLRTIKNQSKKKIQNGPLRSTRPLMEDLYIGNLTNDTIEEEIMAPLELDGNYIFM